MSKRVDTKSAYVVRVVRWALEGHSTGQLTTVEALAYIKRALDPNGRGVFPKADATTKT